MNTASLESTPFVFVSSLEEEEESLVSDDTEAKRKEAKRDRLLERLGSEVTSIYEIVPQIEAAVIRTENRLNEHERRIIKLESSALDREDRASTAKNFSQRFPDYDPERTPHGGLKLEPAIWEQVQKKMLEADAKAEGAKTALKDAQDKAKDTRDKLLFMLVVATTFAGGFTWFFTNLYHVAAH